MFFSIKLFFKALLTVVISVCSADYGRILAGLSGSSHVVRASTNRSGGRKPREGLEIKPQLTNIIRYLWDDFNKKSETSPLSLPLLAFGLFLSAIHTLMLDVSQLVS